MLQAQVRRPVIGLFRLLVAGQGLVLIAGEDTRRHRLSARCCFCKRVGRLVEVPWDVIEFEAIEFVLLPSDLLVVCGHLGIVIA